MQLFGTMVVSKLEAYVYALSDPRKTGPLKDRIFYIGKGNGNRCFNHAQAERGLGEEPLGEREHKLSLIREIRRGGKDVEIHVVQHGMTDEQAHALEAVLIPLLGETNRVAGHGNHLLWLSKQQIDERYDRPIDRAGVPLFRGNILFVSLNQQNISSLLLPDAEAQLKAATLGDWNLGENRSKTVDCIVGVKNGLVVSIFRAVKEGNGTTRFDRIRPDKPRAHGRSRFHGMRDRTLENDLVSRSVFDGDIMISKIRPGAGCQFFPAMSAKSTAI